MQRLIEDRILYHANRELQRLCGRYANGSWLLLFAATVMMTTMLSACGGGASGGPQPNATLSGNWQFTMVSQTDGVPGDPTFSGGLLGGFLLQRNGSVTGQTVYSVTSSISQTGACNSGSAPISVVINGQNVTISEVAGTQTFTLTGTLSSDDSTMMGTYTSTAGTAADGSACGYAETGLSWSAVSVPPLTGSITGSFHSGGPQDNSGLLNQDFPVTGSLTQGENIGASNATVTGTLTFIDPATDLSEYPCIPTGNVSVNGQISGNTVVLQLIGTDGSNDGQIGIALSQASNNGGLDTVTFDSTTNGYVLHSAGLAYVVDTKYCPASAGEQDLGYVCLALNSTAACQEPITLSPYRLTFPGQTLGTPAATQTITLANNSGTSLSGLTLAFVPNTDSPLFGEGSTDFNGLPSFTETDTCGLGGAPSQGAPFGLLSGQSCSIAMTFTPQEECPWLPFPSSPSISGAPPEWCPFPQGGALTVTATSGMSGDNDKAFAVPIAGLGLSAIQPSVPELDFGAEEPLNPPEASLPQTLSFTNNSANPVQILGRASCVNPTKGPLTLPAPRQGGAVAGLQVVGRPPGVLNDILPVLPVQEGPATISYNCDSDPATFLPNFQISSDYCTGSTLAPQASCSVQITYVPQPNTNIPSGGLDYFLELNTLQCWPAGTLPSPSNPCEIDSGRFPVELKGNGPSSLRMFPGAGLDFGDQAAGKQSTPLTITLLNDANLTSPQTVTFIGKILVSGNYSESDDCPAILASASSCTLTVAFKPAGVGFTPGKLTINYTQTSIGGSTITGNPQYVYLRGTGQ
ncbi:MAG TPA: hypothetical protein VK828_09490 [Terriglobales bacterium]|jgi:hypothetical protein|nr:hypothetical protein [Terriglobales bacterium]